MQYSEEYINYVNSLEGIKAGLYIIDDFDSDFDECQDN